MNNKSMNSSSGTKARPPILGQIFCCCFLFFGFLFIFIGVVKWFLYGERDFLGLACVSPFLMAFAIWLLVTIVNLRRALKLIFLMLVSSAGLYALLFANSYFSRWQITLAGKAMKKEAECRALGDSPIILRGKAFFWDLDRGPMQGLLLKSLRYSNGDEPVTVFVTYAMRTQVGTYSISHEPGYDVCRDVYAAEFRNRADDGTPVARHTECSPPHQRREFKGSPEYGDPWPKVADWIRSLSGPAILDAARRGDFGRVDSLLRDSPDLVFSKDDHGETPLHNAAFYGHKDVAELLLAHGADTSVTDKNGYTPLASAVAGGNMDLAEFLRQHGTHGGKPTPR